MARYRAVFHGIGWCDEGIPQNFEAENDVEAGLRLGHIGEVLGRTCAATLYELLPDGGIRTVCTTTVQTRRKYYHLKVHGIGGHGLDQRFHEDTDAKAIQHAARVSQIIAVSHHVTLTEVYDNDTTRLVVTRPCGAKEYWA